VQLPARQAPHVAQHARDEPRDGRLARPGVAEEHHVRRRAGLDVEPELLAARVEQQLLLEIAQLLLDFVEADDFFQLLLEVDRLAVLGLDGRGLFSLLLLRAALLRGGHAAGPGLVLLGHDLLQLLRALHVALAALLQLLLERRVGRVLERVQQVLEPLLVEVHRGEVLARVVLGDGLGHELDPLLHPARRGGDQ